MKKIKYLFLGCLVIMGLFVVSCIRNVDAYDMPIQTVLDQKTDSFTDASAACPYNAVECTQSQTTYCSLGHENCNINHQQQTTTHHKRQSHHCEYHSHSRHH